jgi:hypothetical protein
MKSLFALIVACSVAMGTMPLVGCNSTQALTEVTKFEPVIINVIVLTCTISSGLPICGAMQGTVKADADLVIKLWGDYNAAVKSGTSTLAAWNALNAAFVVFEADSAAIFAAASGLNSPEVAAIVAAAQVLLASIEAFFPGPPAGATSLKSAKFARYGSTVNASYTKAWLNGWIKDYNAKVDAAKKMYPQAKLRKVHIESFTARVATLGWEK